MNRYAKASSSGSSGASATRSVRCLLVLLAGALALSLLFGAGLASAAPPAVSVEDASNVSYTSADVEGTVDPQGQSTAWRFQYATEADFSNAQNGPSGTTATSETLSGQLTGLQPNTTYHLRLVAENGDGTSEAVAANTFTTKEVSKPTLTAPTTGSITASSAQFNAEVTAGGTDPAFQTSCSFDYVTDTSFNSVVNERRLVVIKAEAGTFYIKFATPGSSPPATFSTGPIAFDAPASGPGSVQAALEALPNVPAGSINVTGGPGDKNGSHPYIFEFAGAYSGLDIKEQFRVFWEGLSPQPEYPQSEGTTVANGDPGGFASPATKHLQCDPPSITGTSATPVSAVAAFLQPGTTYHMRLVASNAGGQSQSVSAQTFTTLTLAPGVSTPAPDPVGPETAALDGVVNPHNGSTSYWFEWGTEDCEVSACQSTAHASAGFNEMQMLQIGNGEFNLSLDGQITPKIHANPTGAAVQAALEKLSNIGAGNVSVTGAAGAGEYVITFTGALASTDVDQIVALADPSIHIEILTPLQGGYGNGPKHVVHTLTDLQPETTYHFRLVAQNSTGIVESPDRQFTTAGPDAACPNQGMPGASLLPDCRAYEMVSPPDKHGADVQFESMLTFASASGNALSYAASAGYGDVMGTTSSAQFLSHRTAAPTTNGWSSHAINPAGTAPNINASGGSGMPGFETFNPELTTAVYASWSTLTGYPDPNVTEASNLYRLDDLDATQPLAKLLTHSASPLPASGLTKRRFRNDFVGASQDLSHVFILSPWNLTDRAGAPETDSQGDLYEYTDATGLRRVGRIPAGAETQCDDLTSAPSCVDAAVRPAFIRQTGNILEGGYTQKTISADGSRILFTTSEHPDGAVILLPGQIYMREDGHITYHLNASERTPGSESGDAVIQGMTPDGSRVFFSTNAALINADDDNGARDLYMYEVDKPVGHRLTLISFNPPGANGEADGVVGTSEDGHYVYFVGPGQFVPGEPAGLRYGLYLWHDGDISYIGNFGERISFGAPGVDEISQAQDVNHQGALSSRVSPDGHALLFTAEESGAFAGRGGYPGHYNGGTSCAGSFLGAHDPCRQLYLYSADTGRITCVSCNFESNSVTSDAITDVPLGLVISRLTQHLSHALSDDGRHVFFSTAEALVPEDTNGNYDAYEYDVATESAHLISSGTDSQGSYFLDASPDGHDVFFSTKEKLVGWDTDNNVDVYDARVDGGFPEPTPVPAPCQGESCLPSSPPPPGAPSAASSAPKPRNPKSPRRCGRGFRAATKHGKSRCLKKRISKHRKADTNGRVGK